MLKYSFILFFFANICLGQKVHITCLDSLNQPIPYVNIFVKEGDKIVDGWFTNAVGEASISKADLTSYDSLFFSALGFESRSIAITLFSTSKNNKIVLNESILVLNEVVVAAEKKKAYTRTLGTFKGQNWRGSWSFSDRSIKETYGRMLVAHIKNTESKPGYVKNIGIKLTPDSEPCSAVLRLVVFSVDTALNMPDKPILNTTMLLYQEKKWDRWLSVDLAQIQIILPKEGLYIGLQSLPTDTVSRKNADIKKDLAILKSNDSEAKRALLTGPKTKVQRGGLTGVPYSNTWQKLRLTDDWKHLVLDPRSSPPVYASELIVKTEVLFYK